MIKKLIINLFEEEPTEIKHLDKGITNDNYYVEVNNQAYIVRIPPKENQAIFNRYHEKKAMELVKSLHINIPDIYYDVKSGIKITPYISNLYNFDEYNNSNKIKRTAELMKKLHQAKLQSGFPFDPIKRFYTYYNRIQNPIYDYQPFLSIIDSIRLHSHDLILCHNDWVSGNICFTENDTFLIDYEYAGDNDPLFDVTSFLTENKLTKKQRKEFLIAYFGETITDNTTIELARWEAFHNLLWTVWANMMYDYSKKEIFLTIAREKYEALTNDQNEEYIC